MTKESAFETTWKRLNVPAEHCGVGVSVVTITEARQLWDEATKAERSPQWVKFDREASAPKESGSYYITTNKGLVVVDAWDVEDKLWWNHNIYQVTAFQEIPPLPSPFKGGE